MNLKLPAALGDAAYIENMCICLFCCISWSLKLKIKILCIYFCWCHNLERLSLLFFELLTNKNKSKEIWNFVFCTWFLVVGWCNEINNYHSLFMSFKVCNPPHRDRCHGIFRMIRSVILLGNVHIIHIILLIIYTKYETDEMQLQKTNMQYACKQILCGGG